VSYLKQILHGKQPAPRRLLLYGTHGVGKSSFGASSDRPVFVQTEDGLGEIDCDKFPLALSYQDVIKALGALYTEQHHYRTVVVDSLDWLERLIWAEVCQQRTVENIEDIGYGKGYVFALTFWREFLTGLDAIRNDRNMAVVLIAHSKIERFEDPAVDSYDRYTPRLHKLASQLVQEWCDEIFFATYKVYTKQAEDNFGHKKVKGIGTGERVLYTTERPSHVAKNRLGLPDELPLDWRAYASFFQQSNKGGLTNG
jgi:hypothetical protein